MKCPQCYSLELSQTDIEGITVDFCENCEGIFYDKNELQKLISRTISSKDEVFNKLGKIKDKKKNLHDSHKKCPKDKTIMNSLEYPENSKIIIDFCPKCQGIWTDKDETQKIILQFIKSKDGDTNSKKKVSNSSDFKIRFGDIIDGLIELILS